jgi:alpha-glucosidase
MDEVIYQIYPSSFMDANGDGHGDIQGIIQKLAYIKELGVDAVWISPMYKSPPGAAGDGGYAVEDHCSIDPKFGTMEDFDQLIEEAHKLDLKIYMDFVLPHTSNTHEWFKKSQNYKEPGNEAYKDFYVWHPGHYIINGRSLKADEARVLAAEGKIELPQEKPGMPNNWQSVFGGPAWAWDDKRKEYYLHHFFDSQPAINLNKPEVKQAIFKDMKFWEEKGVKGLRIDSASYALCNPDLKDNDWLHGTYPFEGLGWADQYFNNSMCQDSMHDFIREMRAYFPDMMLVGEVIAGRNGGRDAIDLAEGYIKAGMDYCYTTSERAIGISHPGYMRFLLGHLENKAPQGGLMFTISDHDGYDETPRAYTRMTQNVPYEYGEAAYRQALEIYASMRGLLSVFQGDERGIPHAQIGKDIPYDKIQDHVAYTKGMKYCRDGSRTPVSWDSSKKNAGFSESDNPYLPVPNSHYDKSVNLQEMDPDSTLNFTRNLIAWRKQQPALNKGATRVLKTDGNLLAFVRENEHQTLLCAFNLGTEKFYFKPSDVMDAETLQKIGLDKDDTFVMHPYGSEFAGEHEPVPVKRPEVSEQHSWLPEIMTTESYDMAIP